MQKSVEPNRQKRYPNLNEKVYLSADDVLVAIEHGNSCNHEY
jgi:hypothetical protein